MKPFEDLLVIDLSHVWAGPTVTRILSDLGADVIKVERPTGPDRVRIAYASNNDTTGDYWNRSPYFNVRGAGKRGVTVDFGTEAGKEIFHGLLKDADVLVESFTPRVMASFGFTYAELQQRYPRLIMLSICGYGQTGPHANRAAFGMGMEPASGIASVSGYEGGPPMKSGNTWTDPFAGVHATSALFAALYYRQRTGRGQHIDVSVTECVASSMMATQTMYPFMGGTQHRRRAQGGMFTHPMACADGWIIVQTGGGASWEDICDLFEAPEMMDPRFSDPAQRPQNGAELDRIIVDAIKDRSKWDLFPKAAQARILFGVVQTPRELVECPQLASRDFFREVDHPVIGRIKVPAVLFNFSVSPYQLRCPSPTLGQNNREIYVEGLGYSQEDFCRLRQLNAI
ncbi:MAG: CoA transferase [Chloroflexi bacterium]|nr:CoA transferase [Chloroflexota bacterium]